MASLGDLIKRQMLKKSKSKVYLADIINVGEKTIENYINGNREPTLSDLVKLAVELDIDLEELKEQNVRINKETPALPPGFSELVEAIKNKPNSGSNPDVLMSINQRLEALERQVKTLESMGNAGSDTPEKRPKKDK